jgi:hypothetical protein
MKRIIQLLALAATFAVLAIPAVAQADQCNDDNKGAWYKTFFDNYKGDVAAQKVAYDAAKKYINACPETPEDAQRKYMKKFVDLVDEKDKKVGVAKQFDDAMKNKDYAGQMKYGKEVLANDPDNVDVNAILGIVGLSQGTLLNESVPYARKAIQLIESGKPVKAYSHDQALAYLNWTIGRSQLTTAPAEALKSLLVAAKLDSEVKKLPQLYLDINGAYELGPRKTLSEEYKAKQGAGGTETPESKLVLENLNQVFDRQIDALARAAATATDAAKKKEAMDDLTALYKFRNKNATDANVTELVAGVMSKPIPDLPTPITSLPATPGATPAATPSANGNGAATTGGAKPAGNATTGNSFNGNTTNGGTKPGTSNTGTTAPAGNKRPRLNHRRG